MEYKVVYSDRKTISIIVKNSVITVRAPKRTSEQRIKDVLSKHKVWIEKALEKQSQRKEREAVLSEEEVAELKRRAQTILKDKTAYYANILGLKYGRITITSAKTRFGSCSSKGNIAYSWRLMLYPEPAIDYVVVHELCHLLEMNHSPRFYRHVAGVLPDYKERRALLKK